MSPKYPLDQPGAYRIRVQGSLDAKWADYFENMRLTSETDPEGITITTLDGCLSDQAALQGVLQKLYTLGFPLLSVEKLD